MLRASASSFTLSIEVLVPLTAPILLVALFMLRVLSFETLTARVLPLPFTSTSKVVFAGIVMLVPLTLSAPVPVNVMLSAFVGRERVFTFASLLRVIVSDFVVVLYALRAVSRSSKVFVSVPS